jgi:cation diffusion facilitator family transporter
MNENLDRVEQAKETKNFLGMDEKVWVAFTSVIAAIFLTIIKLIVGILSGSIGILSEALHSALDLVAAGVTFFAVKSSSKPADKEYQFGYGKIESLSALIETLLLLITVVWIMFEATRRIIQSDLEIHTDFWSFGVMILAIVIDFTRSRALYKAAKKYDSQALKADALHFSTDILSSGMVIIGLILTRMGFALGDPLGAIAVAIIVLYMTIKLGKETVHSLLDKAPEGMDRNIRKELERVTGVLEFKMIRIRKSGAEYFVDVVCTMDPNITVEQSQIVTKNINYRIKKVVRGPINLIVHSKPDDSLADLVIYIQNLVSEYPEIKEVHNLHATQFNEHLNLSMHLEVDYHIPFKEAHDIVTDFEDKIQNNHTGIFEIFSHIEPSKEARLRQYDEIKVQEKINYIIENVRMLSNAHNVICNEVAEDKYTISLHCEAEGENSLVKIHRASMIFEDEIKEEMPFFVKVTIHVEPL